jgi:Xaa-Pro aminopeptidase
MAVHERPMISHVSEDILDQGMVFSIEPGIYIPNWGGVRIEDLVECARNGGKLLSEIDKSLTILDI